MWAVVGEVVPMPPDPRGASTYGGWLQSYESGLLSRRDGAIHVTLPESEEQLTLAEYNPAHVRKTTELDLLPAPQRVSRLRSWLDHERPPPATPEPVYASASYDDVSRRASYQTMTQAVRGSSLRPVPTSESYGTPSQVRAASRRGGDGERSSLPALSRGAAPRARRQRRRRSNLCDQRAAGFHKEDARWKLHAGYDPLMSTEEILALGELDDSEEQLVQSVMSQQAQEETFCTWLLNRPLLEPILGNATLSLQKSLDALAEATVFAVEQRSQQLEMPKQEWVQFARKKAHVSNREFNTIWKAYRKYRESSASQRQNRKQKAKADIDRAWHVTAATTYGKPLVTRLADKKTFRRRETKLSVAQQKVDQSKSVWADPIKPPSVSWFSRHSADMPIGGDGRR